jgi:hypothetical protein
VTSVLNVVPEADAKQEVAAPIQAMQKIKKLFWQKADFFVKREV